LKKIFIVLFCMALMASCSGDSTGPEDNGGNGDESPQFEVNYTMEDEMAVSAIVGEPGGNVIAKGPGGVIYTLRFPAGAVKSDTLITITPVSDLTVTGPGTFTCSSSCPELDCCVVGALFEPEGIEFDTCATLEIIFPLGEEFPFDSTAAVFMFDSPHSDIGGCETEIDLPTKTLTAKIWHFTGYGTASAECERLTGIVQYSTETAMAFAGMGEFYGCLHTLIGIESFNRTYDSEGNLTSDVLCEELTDNIALHANEALRAHNSGLMARYSSASMENLDDLTRHLDSSIRFTAYTDLSYEAGQLAGAIRGRILEIAQSLASEANSLCSAGSCEEGQEILYYIEGLGEKGYITDAAFLANVETWIEDCCGGWRLSMSVDKTEILRAIINDGDEPMCVATVTLRVTTSSGEPIEGVFLDADLESGVNLEGGDSDANGEYSVSFSADQLSSGTHFYCGEMLQKELTAEVYDTERSEWVEADPIIVTFRNFIISTTVNYTYTSMEDEDAENFGTTTCSITGGGSSYASDVGSLCSTHCTGVITRAYEGSGCTNGECGANTTIGGAEVPGCIIRPVMDYIVRGDGIHIPVLLGLQMYPDYITTDVHLQFCPDDGECIDFWSDLRNRIEWPGYPGVPENWEPGQGGVYEPFTWTFDETSETRNANASLTVTVEASY
jgi:hypothetical protein